MSDPSNRPVMHNHVPFPHLVGLPVEVARKAGPPRDHATVLAPTRSAVLPTGPTESADALRVTGPHVLVAPARATLLRPGSTYTAAVDVRLDQRLPRVRPDRLRLVVHALVEGQRQRIGASRRAPNEGGSYRVATTVRLPAGTTRWWLALVAAGLGGDQETAGPAVGFSRLAITDGAARVPFFDGDTPTDRWYSYAWDGPARASASVRAPRDPEDSVADLPPTRRRAALADEVLRRLAEGLTDEAAWLTDHLRGPAGDETLATLLDICRAEAAALSAGPPKAEVEASEEWRSAIRREHDARLLAAAGEPGACSPAVDGLLGRRLAELNNRQRLRLAVPRLQAALRADQEPRLGYALGWALSQSGSGEEAQRAITTAAAADLAAGAPYDVTEAAREHLGRMEARREVVGFLATRLDAIRARAEASRRLALGDLGPTPVFMYWGQGFDRAPALVRACRAALELHNPRDDLHFLDDGLLAAYSELPDHVLAINPRHRAAFSDALRLDLLVRHGGFWLDATCFTTASVAPEAGLLHQGDFFAFRKTRHRFASWFLAAQPSSYVVRVLRAAFFLWWEERDDLVDYYLLHHCFEALCRLDERFAAEWAVVPALPAGPPHRLQRLMLEPTPVEELVPVLGTSFVHKLTTGYDEDELMPEAPLALLLRGTLSRPDQRSGMRPA